MKNVVKEIMRNYADLQRYSMNESALINVTEDIVSDISFRNETVKAMRELFNDDAEVQLYADFLENMITKTIKTTYAPDTDMTFILEYTDQVNGNYDMEVIGYYHGESNEQSTNDYKYTLKHV